jgi:hypothetical protein
MGSNLQKEDIGEDQIQMVPMGEQKKEEKEIQVPCLIHTLTCKLYIFLKTGSSNKVGGGANHQPMPIQGPSQ